MSYKTPNRNNFVKGRLRQASLRWPARYECLKRARRERGLYECSLCNKLFKSKEIALDHINPVVPLKGWDTPDGEIDWTVFIKNLFVDVEGWQCLCHVDHAHKTTAEDTMRAFYSEKRREAKKAKLKEIKANEKTSRSSAKASK